MTMMFVLVVLMTLFLEMNSLDLRPKAFTEYHGNVFIFIHACVGIFSKKRGGGTWGHGETILMDMLLSLENATLIQHVGHVFIGLVGKSGARNDLKAQLVDRFSVGSLSEKTSVVVEYENIELSEFPTLNAAQEFSMVVDPHVKIAYMHTKGVRRNGISNYPSEWRQYMQYFLVDRFEICFAALDLQSYCTCGSLKQGKIYAGNFWWSKAGYLASRLPLVSSLIWNTQNRYLAEEYLLFNMSTSNEAICGGPRATPNSLTKLVVRPSHAAHYCIHHTHHNMQLCHSPRQWYESDLVWLPVQQLPSPEVAAMNQKPVKKLLRHNPQCFYRHLTPKGQTKHNASSWCHYGGFPAIPDTSSYG